MQWDPLWGNVNAEPKCNPPSPIPGFPGTILLVPSRSESAAAQRRAKRTGAFCLNPPAPSEPPLWSLGFLPYCLGSQRAQNVSGAPVRMQINILPPTALSLWELLWESKSLNKHWLSTYCVQNNSLKLMLEKTLWKNVLKTKRIESRSWLCPAQTMGSWVSYLTSETLFLPL